MGMDNCTSDCEGNHFNLSLFVCFAWLVSICSFYPVAFLISLFFLLSPLFAPLVLHISSAPTQRRVSTNKDPKQ
jgi:hypothetical protein